MLRSTVRRSSWVAAAIAVLAVAWLVWQIVQVRADLTAVRADTRQLRASAAAGDAPQARRLLPRLQARITDAQHRTADPVWGAGMNVPLLGNELRAVRGATQAADVLAHSVLPDVEQLTELLQARSLLHDGAINLDTVARVSALVNDATAGTARAQTRLAQAPGARSATVRTAVATLNNQLAQLHTRLAVAAAASDLLPSMLGRDSPRRYVLAIQNNAEARATGGLVGAFAIIVVDRGRITLERAGTDEDLKVPSAPVPLPAGAATPLLRIGSNRFTYNLNRTPHFPDAATVLSGIWTAQTAEPVDGVLALDPLAMSDLLRSAPPLNLAPGVTIGSASIAEFVFRREYTLYPTAKDTPPRKKALTALAERLFQTVLGGGAGLRQIRAVVAAGQSGHLFMWSAHPTEQALLQPYLLAGALPADDRPYLEVLTQDNGGDKLSFYLRRSVSVQRRPDGLLNVRVQLTNTAPAGLPAYVTVRADNPNPPVPVGQTRVQVSIYGALSTLIDKVQLENQPAPMSFFTDHGHDVGSLVLELPPGAERTLTLTMTEPPGPLTYRQQPLAQPDTLHLEVPHQVLGH